MQQESKIVDQVEPCTAHLYKVIIAFRYIFRLREVSISDRSEIELNPWIEFDLVRLSSIEIMFD